MHYDRSKADPAYVRFYDVFCVAAWIDSERFAAWVDAHIEEISAEVALQGTEATHAWAQLRFEHDVGFVLPNPEQGSRA